MANKLKPPPKRFMEEEIKPGIGNPANVAKPILPPLELKPLDLGLPDKIKPGIGNPANVKKPLSGGGLTLKPLGILPDSVRKKRRKG